MNRDVFENQRALATRPPRFSLTFDRRKPMQHPSFDPRSNTLTIPPRATKANLRFKRWSKLREMLRFRKSGHFVVDDGRAVQGAVLL